MTPTGLPEPLGQVDALLELEGNWGAVKRYITQVLQARGLRHTGRRIGNLPGMDEILAWYA